MSEHRITMSELNKIHRLPVRHANTLIKKELSENGFDLDKKIAYFKDFKTGDLVYQQEEELE